MNNWPIKSGGSERAVFHTGGNKDQATLTDFMLLIIQPYFQVSTQVIYPKD